MPHNLKFHQRLRLATYGATYGDAEPHCHVEKKTSANQVEASSPRKNMENIGKMKMMKYDEI
jgi:hypothetical protein